MLIAAGVSLLLWYFTKRPVLSMILITLVDAFGFIPTMRKSWHHPEQETLSTFLLVWTKHVISIFAISTYSLVTTLYPAYLVIANTVFISILIGRRKKK